MKTMESISHSRAMLDAEADDIMAKPASELTDADKEEIIRRLEVKFDSLIKAEPDKRHRCKLRR